MKMMHGEIFQARVNTAVTSLLVSPNHLLWIELARMLMKFAPDSLAIAWFRDTRQTQLLVTQT